jgi:hypothetical protein
LVLESASDPSLPWCYKLPPNHNPRGPILHPTLTRVSKICYLALLEAKRAFKYIHVDTRTGETKPIVSNETLAQCFGEAVIA